MKLDIKAFLLMIVISSSCASVMESVVFPVKATLVGSKRDKEIHINLKLENVSEHIVYLTKNSFCFGSDWFFDDWFDVRAIQGGQRVDYVPYKGLISEESLSASDFVPLNVGQLIECKVLLNEYYDVKSSYDYLFIQYKRLILNHPKEEQKEFKIISDEIMIEQSIN